MSEVTNEVVKVEGVTATAIGRYAEIAEMIKGLEAEQKAIKVLLSAAHKNAEATALLTEEGHRSTVIGATVRIGVDADRLAKEQPEIFKAYSKETVIAETVRVNPAKKAKKETLGNVFEETDETAKREADLAALRSALAATLAA
jgi:predicted phage-related endonuclease